MRNFAMKMKKNHILKYFHIHLGSGYMYPRKNYYKSSLYLILLMLFTFFFALLWVVHGVKITWEFCTFGHAQLCIWRIARKMSRYCDSKWHEERILKIRQIWKLQGPLMYCNSTWHPVFYVVLIDSSNNNSNHWIMA